jgi:hypothetical protein
MAQGTTYTAVLSATDQTGNAMAAADVWSFTTAVCPCSLWSDAATPEVASVSYAGSVELGMKFRTDVDGYVTGIRFYEGSLNTGAHIGNLWTAGGALLASVAFTGESVGGWQQVSLSSPVPLTAGTTYVVSYYAPAGGYAYDSRYFTVSVQSGPLRAVADGTNGVYRYGAGGGFPNQSYSSANYWVDVVFSPTAP